MRPVADAFNGRGVNLVEESTSFASIETIDRLQTFATYLSCTFALTIGFCWLEKFGYIVAFSTGVLCLIGLLSSQFLKVLISDLYRQFQYREKFLLFLIHVAAMVCPYFFFRLYVFGKPAALMITLSILLVMLSFQAMDKLFLGRLLAVQFLIVAVASLYFRDAVSSILIYTWFALFLFSIRYAHVAQRLEDFSDGAGIERWPALRRGVVSILVVVACGIGAGWAAGHYLPRYHFSFQIPPVDSNERPFEKLSDGQLLWRAFILFVMIGALLVVMKWIDSKLLRKKGSAVPIEGDAVATTKAYRADQLSEEPLSTEQVSGPRERILSAFRQFNDRLQGVDLGRKDNETVPDYFLRLERTQHELQALQYAGSSAFDHACYGDDEPTATEADQFVSLLNEKIQSLRGGRDER